MDQLKPRPHGLKPTCREVHQLVSKGLDCRLTMVERGRMGVHLVVCSACRRFDQQMDLLRRAVRQGPPADMGGE